jgi:hypothetical protein
VTRPFDEESADMRLFGDLKDAYDVGGPRVRAIVLGICFFLGATFVLWTMACPHPQSGCSGSDPHAVAVLAGLIECVLIVLLASPRGRWFDAGFLGALLVATFYVGGAASAVWEEPFATSPSTAWKQERRAARNEWVRLHRSQQPGLVHAARLVNQVEACAEAFRADDSTGSYPRSDSALTSPYDCSYLAGLAIGADSAPIRLTASDNGWRWSYLPGAADSTGPVVSYRVVVTEDPVLKRPAPTFSGDQRGGVRQQPVAGPEILAATPVPALLTLQNCLTRLPPKRPRPRPYWGGSDSPLVRVSSECPDLRGHLRVIVKPDDSEHATLAISVDPRAGDWYDTVAVYTIEAVPVDTTRGVFELLAKPSLVFSGAVSAGVRYFFVGRDGSVHSRVGKEYGDSSASAADPIAAECRRAGDACTPIRSARLASPIP